MPARWLAFANCSGNDAIVFWPNGGSVRSTWDLQAAVGNPANLINKPSKIQASLVGCQLAS